LLRKMGSGLHFEMQRRGQQQTTQEAALLAIRSI